LNAEETRIKAQIRNLVFDLNLETEKFLSRISGFDDHGLMLLQSIKPMPASLFRSEMPNEIQDKILVQNGVTLKIYLPHAIETAVIVSYRTDKKLAQILDAFPDFTGGST
jgi:hypothetical protein